MGRADSPDDCDCLMDCGSDSWLRDGRATPCEYYCRVQRLTLSSADAEFLESRRLIAEKPMSHTPPDASMVRMLAISLLLAERNRQIVKEGFTLDHDNEHSRGELPGAASAMLLLVADRNHPHSPYLPGNGPPPMWPADWDWKPKADDRMLVMAGALILAEIERRARTAGYVLDEALPTGFFDA